MYDARTFVNDLSSARTLLEEMSAQFKGAYEIHDVIYAPKDTNKTLGDEFLRLRVNKKNIWNEKDVIVMLKGTINQTVGKRSVIQIREEFDTRDEAEEYIKRNLLAQFTYAYEFNRIGWQYDLENSQIDLEDIEGHYSIEFKAPTPERLRELLSLFSIIETISGPSVITIQKLLNK
jgi:adenylate cyclase class IV